MGGNENIRVFVLDDHELVRRGVRDLLSREDGIEVVGEAATAVAAVALVPRLAVHVAVLDVWLPDGSGTAACREIRSASPDTACLMLTGHADDKAMLAAIMAGAVGYVNKAGIGEELAEAVRAAASGASALSPEATWRVRERLRTLVESGPAVLTGLDRDVLTLIEQGLTNNEIAAEMNIPEQVVRDSVSALLSMADV
jgi:two-component system response regulator DevR